MIRSLQSRNETFRFHFDGRSEATHVFKHGSDNDQSLNAVGEKAEKLVWKTAVKLPGGGNGEPELGSRWWQWKDALEQD